MSKSYYKVEGKGFIQISYDEVIFSTRKSYRDSELVEIDPEVILSPILDKFRDLESTWSNGNIYIRNEDELLILFKGFDVMYYADWNGDEPLSPCPSKNRGKRFNKIEEYWHD